MCVVQVSKSDKKPAAKSDKAKEEEKEEKEAAPEEEDEEEEKKEQEGLGSLYKLRIGLDPRQDDDDLIWGLQKVRR